MSISSEQFREAMRHFPAGVTIVTIKLGEQIHGLTVSAFVSVSPDPPLIAVFIDQRHGAHQMLEQEGAVFAVNILRHDQAHLSNRFAWVQEDRFAEGDWGTAVTGAPILRDALVWVDCTIYGRHDAGTHTIYVGEIQASHVPVPDDKPLVYWNRDYQVLGA
ncbi:MAG: flavin reductase family protein [Chloroflexi bacterium]|nr:flavin reductase family protein [Chloroflexota bacterium]